MDRGAWWATVHRVAKSLSMTVYREGRTTCKWLLAVLLSVLIGDLLAAGKAAWYLSLTDTCKSFEEGG